MERGNKVKYEYRVIEIDMFFKIMTAVGNEGWQLITANNTMVFLQRSIFPKKYSYDTCQDGYVIYGPDNKKINPWDLVNLLK